MLYRVWTVSIATTQNEYTLLLSFTIDLRTFMSQGVSVYFIQREHGAWLQHSFCLAGGFVVGAVGSFSMLQLCCSIHLVGCFICILLLFHSFSGVSPHPSSVMHFSYNTPHAARFGSVDSLPFLSYLHTLSYTQTHAHLFNLNSAQTFKSDFWLKQNHVYFCIKCLCPFRYQKGASLMWKHSRC